MIFDYDGVEVDILDKSELVIGQLYYGDCRNSSTAIWTGQRFKYMRYKFGIWDVEEINHPEDDDGHDLFLPLRELNIKEEE